MAIKVTLRRKPIKWERQSLYLDIYPPITSPKTGKQTRREFLGIYIIDKPKNNLEKSNNKEKIQLAEQIRFKRENQLNKPEIYTGFEKEQLKIKERGEKNFVDYFKKLSEKRTASNYDNWSSAYNYLKSFTNGNIKFINLNEEFCNDFKEYLLNTKSNRSSKKNLCQNSAASYFNKIKATLKQAYKEGYLKTDLNAKIDPIKTTESHRNFLTIEELNILVKTECNNNIMKNAALFSALTGLRFSDIKNLIWDELIFIKGTGYFIKFTQQKTNLVEMQPISEQAYNLLGERKKPSDIVFEGLIYSDYENKKLKKWIKNAGINKKITFHNFRHTYATLQLSLGTDIYTISKLLGHRNLKTTMIYTKIIDEKKRIAANKIKLDI